MLNKFSILVPVLLISASITGCSGTKSQSNSALQTPNSSMVKTPTIKTAIKEKIKLVPVVFEKRSPAKRIQNRVQKPRYTQPKINNNSRIEIKRQKLNYNTGMSGGGEIMFRLGLIYFLSK